MAPLVGEAAATITALVNHNATTTLFLWLLNVQAVLYMGYEGEPRVAGGCIEDDIGNTAIIAQCSENMTSSLSSSACLFYRGGDAGVTHYLAMSHNGRLESLTVLKHNTVDSLVRAATETNPARQLDPVFKLRRRSCPERECGVFVSSYQHGHYVSIYGKLHLSKLQVNAVEDCTGPDKIKKCLNNPGPVRQRPSKAATKIILNPKLNVTCQKSFQGKPYSLTFTSKTCPMGRLRKTYPVGFRK